MPRVIYKRGTTPVYKLLFDELEDSIHVRKVEHESAVEHLKQLEEKISNPGLKPDKTKGQCSQCHMRVGHTKRHCNYGNYGPCESLQICGDIDKHENEKELVLEAAQNVKSINVTLKNLKQNLSTKKQTWVKRFFCVFF